MAFLFFWEKELKENKKEMASSKKVFDFKVIQV